MSTAVKKRYTPEEYLALERQSAQKSQYYQGEIFAMGGASKAHNLITVNIASELRRQLKGRECEAYVADMRVKVPQTALYTYPDVVVVCGQAQFEDECFDTLLNPRLIIEVLSASTAAYDRGGKFNNYRAIESLEQFVVVEQDKPMVEVYTRGTGNWTLVVFDRLDATAPLHSIKCELSLKELYDKVQFPAGPTLI